MQLWDRGYWESDDPDRGFKKGDLKFTLHGDKLHGSWVLVRMKGDRYGGKRTNWLLIKHRDEFASEGETNDILDEDRSVASGRSMEEIAKGKGKAPKPFMLAKGGKAKADAIWNSNRGDAAEARAQGKASRAVPPAKARASARPKKVDAMPDFVAPQLCASVERPPNSDGWCHEIKFDGYRMQLRVEDGEAVLNTRKGLDWTEKFGAIAKEAAIAARCTDRWRDRRPRSPRRAGLLGAAGGHIRRQDRYRSSSSRSICCSPVARTFASLPLGERKARLKQLLASRKGKADPIRRAFRGERR